MHLQKLGLLMAHGTRFPNTPGEAARVQGFPEGLRNSSPFPQHSILQTLRSPSAGWEGVQLPSKMAALFCTSEGVTRRLPFASGDAVKVLLPSLALCPRWPDSVSSPGRPAVPGWNLPGPRWARLQHEARLWRDEAGRAPQRH